MYLNPLDPEEETPEQTAPVEPSEHASPEELGVGNRQSNEPFSPIDFDSIIDKAAGDLTPAGEKPPVEEKQKPEDDAGEQPENKSEETAEDNAEEKAEEPAAKAEETPEKEAETTPEKKEEKPEGPDPKDEELSAIEKKMGPHAAPKTKQLFNEVKAIAAREKAEREKLAKELADLKAKQPEPGKSALPKEVEEEIAALRDRVRQIDANSDPAIVAKYDKTISANNDSILQTLTEAGLPAEHAERLKKSGLSLANLKPYLDTLETGKGADGKQYEADPDTAEKIREALRENMRLAKDKDREIADWRTNYEARTKQQEEQQKVQLEQATQRLNTEFDAHLKKWDFLQKPAAVADSDAPAIRKQKEAAIAAFNEKSLQYAEAVKKETASPLDAQVAARIGILYRDHVAPSLAAKVESLQQQNKDLQKQIDSMKKAGSASRTVGVSKPSATPKREVNPNQGFDDIIDEVAREAFSNQS